MVESSHDFLSAKKSQSFIICFYPSALWLYQNRWRSEVYLVFYFGISKADLIKSACARIHGLFVLSSAKQRRLPQYLKLWSGLCSKWNTAWLWSSSLLILAMKVDDVCPPLLLGSIKKTHQPRQMVSLFFSALLNSDFIKISIRKLNVSLLKHFKYR